MRVSEDAKGADSFIFEMEPQGDWTRYQYGFEGTYNPPKDASADHHDPRGYIFGFEDLPSNAEDSFDFKADAGRETPPPPTDPIIIADIPEPLPQPVEDVVKDPPPTDPILVADIPHPVPQPVEPYVDAIGGYLI